MLVSSKSADRGNAVYAEFDGSRIGRTMRFSLGVDRGNAVYAEFLGFKGVFHTLSDWSGCSVPITVVWDLQN